MRPVDVLLAWKQDTCSSGATRDTENYIANSVEAMIDVGMVGVSVKKTRTDAEFTEHMRSCTTLKNMENRGKHDEFIILPQYAHAHMCLFAGAYERV